MDMILTIIASTLMLVGFFVICRSSDEDEDEVLQEVLELPTVIPIHRIRTFNAKTRTVASLPAI